jgi:threonine dehydrogenase-like Zn-dependent dehydrogenase
MKGLVFLGRRQVELRNFDDPTPGPGEVVISVKASGLCGSDLHMYRRAEEQPGDFIGGHEPCGIVVGVGPGVTNPVAREGARVMVHHYSGCGGCSDCRAGWQQMCSEVPVKIFGGNSNGAHAEFMKVPAETILMLHDSLSFLAGATIGCGTGTAWGALERLNVTGRDTVAVFGQGPVGLSTTLLASALGARVIALDISDNRLSMAKRFGADAVIDASGDDTASNIKELTDGKGVTVAIETSGASVAAEAALASLRPWGRLGMVGIGAKLELDSRTLLMRQLSVMTSWTMSWLGQKACADFVVERGLNLDALFSDTFPLVDAVEAYKMFDIQDRGKAAFTF